MNIGTFHTTCKFQLKCHNHDVCKVVYILKVGNFSTTQLMINNNSIQSQERQPKRDNLQRKNVKCNCYTNFSADPCKINYFNMQEKNANLQVNYVYMQYYFIMQLPMFFWFLENLILIWVNVFIGQYLTCEMQDTAYLSQHAICDYAKKNLIWASLLTQYVSIWHHNYTSMQIST